MMSFFNSSILGFSDFYSGTSGTSSQYQFQGTTVGGGSAKNFKVHGMARPHLSA